MVDRRIGRRSRETRTAGYAAFLTELKARIRNAQVKAAVAVNRELIELYWGIGRDIVRRQRKHRWGRSIVERLARDLTREFPQAGGFSPRNLWRMRAFYVAWADGPILPQAVAEMDGQQEPGARGKEDSSILAQAAREMEEEAILPQVVAELPWGHNIVLMERVKDARQRLWYAKQAAAHGWSRNMLEHWIDSGLHRRHGKAITNFERTLPPAQSDLAIQTLKDPYMFDFLTIREDAREKEVEEDLLSHITRFLLELGAGFAFVGRQYRIEVEGKEYAIDLLLYHVRLHCFVVIDLKIGGFLPEFAGKMNFYLSAVDDLVRGPGDQPSIGLILCRQRECVSVEYALRDVGKPIGVAGWHTRITDSLPPGLRGSLPTIAQIERELSGAGRQARVRRGKKAVRTM